MLRNPHTSFRLSGEGRELLALLGKFYGLSMTAVLEMLIRERADTVVKRERQFTPTCPVCSPGQPCVMHARLPETERPEPGPDHL